MSGLIKRKGRPIRLYTMSHLREVLYPRLPNGRYYEYFIRNDDCFAGKQCKDYCENETPLILEVYEDIESQHIYSQNICVDVRGGRVKFKDCSNERASNKRRDKNAGYAEFIQSHERMGNLTATAFYWFTEFYNYFQQKNKSLPYKFKDLLYHVYQNKSNPKEQKKASEAFVVFAKKTLSEGEFNNRN